MKNSRSTMFKFPLILLLASILAACGTSKKNSGAYYQDDGPGKKRVDIESIPDAIPRFEPFNKATLKPYTVNGKRYVPLQSEAGFLEEGRASWYGKKYHGRKTSTSEVYDMYKMTAAHPTLPLPSYVRVTNVANQRSVVVRLNDRGPFIGDRIIDLSYVAAQKLGVVSSGTGNVIVESLSSNYENTTTTQKAFSNPAYSSSAVQPQGEITAGNEYRYNLPASQQSVTKTAPQLIPTPQSPSPQSPQRPQLVPSAGGSVGDAGSKQTNQAYNNTPQQNQVTQPRFSTGQWIQTGAFSTRKNAEKLVARLNGSGYQNVQINQQNSLYKVLVGPISQQQTASTQRSLKVNGYAAILAKP